MKNLYSLRFIPFGLFLLLGLFLWRGLALNPHELPSVKIGQDLPNFELNSLTHQRLNSHLLANKKIILNVFASWCQACEEEQVFLLKLSREGQAIYGLAYKDNPTQTKAWLKKWGNPYRQVGLDIEGLVARDLGVYGTPETFLIDNGMIRYRYAGVLDEKVWQTQFVPLLKNN